MCHWGVRHDNRFQEEVQIRCVLQAKAMYIQESHAFWQISQRKYKIKLNMWQLQMYWIFGNHKQNDSGSLLLDCKTATNFRATLFIVLWPSSKIHFTFNEYFHFNSFLQKLSSAIYDNGSVFPEKFSIIYAFFNVTTC